MKVPKRRIAFRSPTLAHRVVGCCSAKGCKEEDGGRECIEFHITEVGILLCPALPDSPRGVRGRFAALLVLPSALNCSASQVVDPFDQGGVAGRMCSRPKQYTTTPHTHRSLLAIACIPTSSSCQHSWGALLVTAPQAAGFEGCPAAAGSEHSARSTHQQRRTSSPSSPFHHPAITQPSASRPQKHPSLLPSLWLSLHRSPLACARTLPHHTPWRQQQ